MLTASVKPVFNWRNKKNKKNCYPVHLEIKIDGIRKYYRVPVPLDVTPDQWCGKDDGYAFSDDVYAARFIALKSQRRRPTIKPWMLENS
jgi:hypothetical protein